MGLTKLCRKLCCTVDNDEAAIGDNDYTWEQSRKDVVVRINVGKRLKPSDLNAVFTETGASIVLTDGRKWEFKFSDAIVPETCRVKRSRKKIVLILKKKEPGISWPTLEALEVEQVSSPKVQAKDEKKEKTKSPRSRPRRYSDISAIGQLRRETEMRVRRLRAYIDAALRRMSIKKRSGSGNIERERRVTSAMLRLSRSEPELARLRRVEEQEKNKPKVPACKTCMLDFIPNTWREQDERTMDIWLHQKKIDISTVTATFQDKHVSIQFQTGPTREEDSIDGDSFDCIDLHSRNESLLSVHTGTSKDTVFIWNIQLPAAVDPYLSDYQTDGETLNLHLVKIVSRKWNTLLAIKPLNPSEPCGLLTSATEVERGTHPTDISRVAEEGLHNGNKNTEPSDEINSVLPTTPPNNPTLGDITEYSKLPSECSPVSEKKSFEINPKGKTEPITNIEKNEPIEEHMSFATIEEIQPIAAIADTEPITTIEDTEPITTIEDTEPITTIEENSPNITIEENMSFATIEEIQPIAAIKDTEPIATIEDTEPIATIEENMSFATIEEIQPIAAIEATEPIATIEENKSFASIEEIQPIATIEATEPIATIEENKSFATIEEIQPIAAIEDTEPIATNEENMSFATIEEIQPIAAIETTEPIATIEENKSFSTIEEIQPIATIETTEPIATIEKNMSFATIEEIQPIATIEATEPIATIEENTSFSTIEEIQPIATIETTEPIATIEKNMSFATIEEIQPIATIEATEPIATNEENKSFASIEEIQPIATIEATEPIATIEENMSFATIQEIQPIATIEATEPIATIEKNMSFATIKEIQPIATIEATEPIATNEENMSFATIEEIQPTAAIADTEPIATIKETMPVVSNEEIVHIVTIGEAKPSESICGTESMGYTDKTEPITLAMLRESINEITQPIAVKPPMHSRNKSKDETDEKLKIPRSLSETPNKLNPCVAKFLNSATKGKSDATMVPDTQQSRRAMKANRNRAWKEFIETRSGVVQPGNSGLKNQGKPELAAKVDKAKSIVSNVKTPTSNAGNGETKHNVTTDAAKVIAGNTRPYGSGDETEAGFKGENTDDGITSEKIDDIANTGKNDVTKKQTEPDAISGKMKDAITAGTEDGTTAGRDLSVSRGITEPAAATMHSEFASEISKPIANKPSLTPTHSRLEATATTPTESESNKPMMPKPATVTPVEHNACAVVSGTSLTKCKSGDTVQPDIKMTRRTVKDCKTRGTTAEKKRGVIKLGKTGLKNQGNTCYMNSVIQILANTVQLKDYLISGAFKADLNLDSSYGCGGRAAIVFSELLTKLWSGLYKTITPNKIRYIIGLYADQFRGNYQHDAQELMTYLLDMLHEDLNKVKDKPYVPGVESNGRPDLEVAQEAWHSHLRRENSIIVDIFKGQYKSGLTCLTCRMESPTFEPFMAMSVPVPKLLKVVPVVFWFKLPWRQPIKCAFEMRKTDTIKVLKQKLQKFTGVKMNKMTAYMASRGKLEYFLPDTYLVPVVTRTETLCVSEIKTSKEEGEKVYHIGGMQSLSTPICNFTSCSSCHQKAQDLMTCQTCFTVAYCSTKCRLNHFEAHISKCVQRSQAVGVPFLMSIPKSKATFNAIVDQAQTYGRFSLAVSDVPRDRTKRTFTDNATQRVDDPPFILKPSIINTFGCMVELDGRQLVDQGKTPLDVFFTSLTIEWKNHDPALQVEVIELKATVDDSAKLYNPDLAGTSVTLESCIEDFMKPEVLDADQTWNCPKCLEPRQATKQMSICRPPQNLIIQLKRFRHIDYDHMEKINTPVIYPIHGLDLSRFVLKGLCSQNNQPIYDLYGGINHTGFGNGGHYRAFGRCLTTDNPWSNNIGWRLFDDAQVKEMDVNDVQNSEAYLLFYRRRS